MTERIERLKQFFIMDKAHHQSRFAPKDEYLLAESFEAKGLSDIQRAFERLETMLRLEKPILFPIERIVFTRRSTTVFALFTQAETERIKSANHLHERGEVCNISVDYTKLLNVGFAARIQALSEQRKRFQTEGQEEQTQYIDGEITILRDLQALSDQYRELAEEQGRREIASMLARVPAHAPQTFPEALQMFRIVHFAMWLGGNYHNTIGRLDQYMYPYYRDDLAAGRLTKEEALEWLEEFFITFNRDSDLYPGMQQGDNGQSIMLGGLNPDGSSSYNELSELCLQASLELSLIDPKINLRVSRNTPLDVYILGSKLTKQGLGFPQYANDDVVIPALLSYGYAPRDAYNYTVAACWEFIVPGTSMDVPNIDAVSFALAAQQAVEKHLLEGKTPFPI